MLTPLDIHNKEFKKGFRGYNEDDVDQFLDKVIKDFEKLYRENIELKETLERLSAKLEHYQNLETTLNNTLVVAQETAEDVKLNAKKEAELILKEAEVAASRTVEEARGKARKLTGEFEDLQRQTHIYRGRMRTLLQAQLDMLNAAEEENA
ncbi:MAG: DivIVA domain-containing protein [Sporomusaceae bacterium]|nr:DivIVA domain-containing protein [Sporomusaceae bacterium]